MKENQTINELPKDWSLKKLGDVCLKVEQVKRKAKDQDEEILYLDIGGIDNASNKIVSHKEYKWSDAPSRAQQIVRKGDILFSTVRTYLKNIAQVESEIFDGQIASSGFCVIRANEEMNPKFLFYLSLSEKFLRPLNELQTGSSYPAVRDKDVFNQLVPKPPKNTQLQIVSKIEELFSELDKGIEELKTAQQQLKVYRQAVLKWAFEGKLTNGWRDQNNISVDALLQAVQKEREIYFKDAFKKLKTTRDFDTEENESLFNIPNNWRWIRIVDTVFNTSDDIVDGPFGSNLKNSDFTSKGTIPVIGITNIDEGFEKGVRYITEEKFQTVKRSGVYPGDIIVAKIGSSYGKVGTYPEDMPTGVIPANLLRIKPSRFYQKQLLLYYLKSRIFKVRLEKIMKSTAQPAYNVSQFKELPIPIMSVEEQQQIVQEIESRLSVCDKIEETITDCLKQAGALRQSILKKAFEGNLFCNDSF